MRPILRSARRTYPMLPRPRDLSLRLRALDMDDVHANESANVPHNPPLDVLPFSLAQGPGAARPWVPEASPRVDGPGRTGKLTPPASNRPAPHLSEDSIANAESALSHVERRLENLRKLLGDTDPNDGPRAA